MLPQDSDQANWNAVTGAWETGLTPPSGDASNPADASNKTEFSSSKDQPQGSKANSNPKSSSSSKRRSTRRSRRTSSQRSAGTPTNDATLNPVSGNNSAGNPTSTSSEPATRTENSQPQRYSPVEEVGRGGWGVVRRAVDEQLQRDVAVKQLLSPSQDREARDQFVHEAKITGQLQHPGIVPVHELGKDEVGRPYYVMKLLEGCTLRDHIRAAHDQLTDPTSRRADAIQQRDNPSDQTTRGGCVDSNAASHNHLTTPNRSARHLPRQWRAAVLPLLERFVDVCQAVAYTHREGIIHRDLKPSNVMVGAFGETIVVDWGLAQICAPADPAEAESLQATRGSIIGTPSYMSPEQAAGQTDKLGPTSDIFALGVMLREILTNRNPLSASDVPSTLQRVQRGDWQPIRTEAPWLPKPLAAICDAAMAFDQTQRFASAEKIAEDVRAFIAGDAVSVCQENVLDRIMRWCRHHQTAAVTIALCTSVLLVASVIFTAVIHQAHQAELIARQQAEVERELALDRLSQSRDSADAWLVDLSGVLQFYPGMQPIRNDLLRHAKHHYEQLLQQNPFASESVHSVSSFDGLREFDRKALLEQAKAQLRLGDVYRLTDQIDDAAEHYADAKRLLNNLMQKNINGSPERLAFADQVRVQWVNATIGHVLQASSTDSTSNLVSKQEMLVSEVGQCQTWLFDRLSDGDSTEQADIASALGRLQLAVHQNRASGFNTRIADFEQAVMWSQWLTEQRGEARDHLLAEQLRKTLARKYQNSGQLLAAQEQWALVVQGLLARSEASPTRIDLKQSLAYAKLELASLFGKTSRREDAQQQCLEAIDQLESAWALSDADAFYRTNLATAHHNRAGWTDDAEAASHSLRKSIQTYQALLAEEVNADTLRRLGQAYHQLAKRETANASNSGAESNQTNWESAALAYELLSDHDLMQGSDAMDQLRVWIGQSKSLFQQGDSNAAIQRLKKVMAHPEWSRMSLEEQTELNSLQARFLSDLE